MIPYVRAYGQTLRYEIVTREANALTVAPNRILERYAIINDYTLRSHKSARRSTSILELKDVKARTP